MADKDMKDVVVTEAPPTKAATKAAVDQAQEDLARGYVEEEWLPGVPQLRSLITGHTISGPNAEREMRAHHAELGTHGIVDPRAGQ